MATAKKSWTAQTWINAAGAGLYDTLSGTTEEYTSAIDCVTNGYIGTHIMADINFDSTPTDNVNVKIYGSLDGTNWDNIPINTVLVVNTTDPSSLSFVIEGFAYVRVGFSQTGSTDTHDFRCSSREWNINIT